MQSRGIAVYGGGLNFLGSMSKAVKRVMEKAVEQYATSKSRACFLQ
jgi:hypothetical protein